ncbi:MAG: hypothetical protein PHR84_02840 [Candidatus Omnitrophica bacterium]|nr:hypothetical protein [Candidatus Omnitrophota bacterium]MDD5660725.1 hypothetical protein [Candidatus Omnitrophota bacterium]
MKRNRIAFFAAGFLLLALNFLYAKDITVVYTGQTHAMLYPCSCPFEQDGGIARRASLINELRKTDPELLLLDCGSFTAGGPRDEYTQDIKLDIQRSLVNFKAMELMRYDAVGVSPDEFNFGKEFFLSIARVAQPAFLSANLGSDKVVPYIIKDIKGVKIGIIGLTGLTANQKAEGLKISEPKKLAGLISQLKRKGAKVIILISNMSEKEDLKLISEVKDIDMLFIGQDPLKAEPLTKVGSTFMLRPSWQGRKIGKLTLEVKDGRLIGCKAEEIVVSDKIADDAQILSILPRCYSDNNCKKEGFIGACNHPGELDAECTFTVPNKIGLRVVSAKDCVVCNVGPVINLLKKRFPGLAVQYLYYPDPAAKKLIKDMGVSGLPVYILDREVEKEVNFNNIRNDFEFKQNFYLLKPHRSGLSYLFDRKKKKGSLDVFFSIFAKDADKFLSVIKDFKPNLHFLALQQAGEFEAQNGAPEVGEYLRGVCVQKYYPKKFWDYLICRSKNLNSVYWDDCLSGLDLAQVKVCATGKEGRDLLGQNIALSKELKIMFGPTYLLNNQEIFSSLGVPDKEELEKIIKTGL